MGTIKRAWKRFSDELFRSQDAPYPGMIEAFEKHYGQSWVDREWRDEARTWAAAWKAAIRHAETKPRKPGVRAWHRAKATIFVASRKWPRKPGVR